MAELLLGSQRPRLELLPAIEYNDRAAAAIELAELAGLHLDDWQRYCIHGIMGMDVNHLWSAFEVCLIVSRQNGKGSILEARELAGLFLIKTDRLMIHTAHEHKTSSEHYRRMWSLIDNAPDLAKKIARHSSAYGREFIETKTLPTFIFGAKGTEILRQESKRLIFIARTGGSGRGFTGDLLVYDEDMILDAEEVGSSLPSLSARPNPQVLYTGSAGNRKSTQLANVRRRGVDKSSSRLFFAEWSVELCDDYCSADCAKHADPYAEETVAKTNPGYNIRLSPSVLEAERESFQGLPEEYARERLGVGTYPAPADGWFVIAKRWWENTLDKTENPPRVQSPIFAIDADPDRKHATIAVAGWRPDERTGVQIVDHREGMGWIAQRVIELHEQWEPKKWIVDKRAAAGSLITELTDASIPVEWLQATQVSHACGLIYDAFKDNTLSHYGQADLRKAIAGADQRKLSESWAFDRVNSGSDLSPLMAVTFAYWGFLEFGDDISSAESMGFDVQEVMRIYRAGRYTSADLQRLYASKLLNDLDVEVMKDAGISF